MQYSKCTRCIHNGKRCKIIMANVMSLLGIFRFLINYSQRQPKKEEDAYCHLDIQYDCKNFKEKIKNSRRVENV